MRIGPAYLVVIAVLFCIAAGAGGYLASSGPFQPAPLQRQQEVVVGKFTAVSPPLPAPAVSFAKRDGKPLALKDFRGRWLLINLWATWCSPCIKEMPSLDRMQAGLRDTLDVVAVSEDRGGAKIVEPFLTSLHIGSLTVAFDTKGDMTGAFHIDGLPTSLLIDPQGRVVAKLEGSADWEAAPTLTALKGLMTQTASAAP